MKGEVDRDAGPAELGRAEIVVPGDHITVVTWSSMRQACLSAAENLHDLNINAEVIDLRTLWPWDRDTVFHSVSKTGRVLIVHEAVRAGGFGAEIAAELGEAFWGKLRAPIRRIGQERVPMPYSKPLESHFRITPDLILTTAAKMVQ